MNKPLPENEWATDDGFPHTAASSTTVNAPTPTPETDAAKFKIISKLQSGTMEVVPVELSEKLERERDQLRKIGDELAEWMTGNVRMVTRTTALINYENLPHVKK